MPRFPLPASTAATLSDTVFSRLVAKARASGKTFHALHVGDTYLEPLEGARAEDQRAADHPALHTYSPVAGEPKLLDAIELHLERRLGRRPARECLQVVSGATSGLSVVVDALHEPGEAMMILAPYWPLVRGTCARRGVHPLEVPFFDRLPTTRDAVVAHLEAHWDPRVTSLYVNSPHNPTGSVLGQEQLEGLASFARAHELWVLSDEVYDELAYEPCIAPWTVRSLADRAIAIHSVSKAYALAGARVGFVHGPPTAMQAIRGVQTFSTYCAAKPMQLAAAHALVHGEPWIATTRAHYRELGERAAQRLGVPAPRGGTFLFLDSRPHLRPGEDGMGFLERCLDAGVLLTPGASSGAAYKDWVRLCFTLLPPAQLDDALARLAPLFGRP